MLYLYVDQTERVNKTINSIVLTWTPSLVDREIRVQLIRGKSVTVPGKGYRRKKDIYMSKETKTAKTVEVKLLIPYAIIALMIIATTGVITGWFMRSEQMGQVQREASELVSHLKETK